MSEEIKETVIETADENKFGGFTLEELRYHRALTELKREYSKAKIADTAHKIQKRNPFSANSSSSGLGKVGGIAGKLITGMSYVDYAMIGFSLFNSGRKIFSFIKKKK